MKIVFLSHTAIDASFRVGSHHLSRGLALLGHEVWHVSTPVTLRTVLQRRKQSFLGTWIDSDGVKHWKPLVLLPMWRARNVWSLSRQFARRRLRSADVVIVDQPLMSGVVEFFRDATVIYRPTDIVGTEVLRARQSELLHFADAVVTTSSAVLEDLALADSRPTLVLANGVDTEHFEMRKRPAQAPAGFVYVGSLSARFDWEAVRVLAAAFPTERIDIYGPVVGESPTFPSTVRLLGPLRYEELPATLARYRVGLLPLASLRINEGRSPMKFYEYSAAGLSVLARRTPSLIEDFALDSVPHAFGYDSHTDLAEAARRALSHDVPDRDAMTLAATQSWASKAQELDEFLYTVHEDKRRDRGLQ